jgi:transposase
MIIKQIIFIEEQIDHLDLELETLVRKIDSQIITIPGIVPTNAAAFSNYYSSLLDFL